MAGIKKMATLAVGLVALSALSLMGIAVVNGFKDTNLVANATADAFIAGLAVFGSFATVLAIAVVAKAVIGELKSGF